MNLNRAVLRTALNTTSLVSPAVAGKQVYALFRKPIGRTAPRPAEQQILNAAQQGSVAVGGRKIVTYRWGDGDRPVLLLHGWGSCAGRMTTIAAALHDSGQSVVALDAPGHGASEGKTTTILELRDAMRAIQREARDFTSIVGHSFGALCSFFAAREGVRTGSLVGISGVSRFDHVVTSFADQFGLRPRLAEELRREIENTAFPGEAGIWERFSSPAAPQDLRVRRILLVHDEGDRVVGVHQSREIAEAYGERASLEVTTGLGHNRILVDPGVVRRVAEFIQLSRDAQPAT